MRNFYVIPLRTILPPEPSPFPDLVKRIVESVPGKTNRRNRPSSGTVAKWRLAATLLLDGLYQAHHSFHQPRFLGVPLHRSAYGSQPDRVDLVGYEVMINVLKTAEALGFVFIRKGFKRADDDCEMSTVLPGQDLTDAFKALGEVWLKRKPPKGVIFRRNRGKKRGQERPFGVFDDPDNRAFEIGASKADKTRQMQTALRAINKRLVSARIGLCVRNEQYPIIAAKLMSKRLRRRFNWRDENGHLGLNLNSVCLRRIFSHGSMRKGGRFYGNFGQRLPKDDRVHLTIDCLPTIEIDYSGLHPTMAYHLEGLDPPSDDPYDIGIWSTPEEKLVHRPIIKGFFNAMLNDEDGVAILSRSEAKKLGIGSAELRRQIVKAHPAISHRFDSGFGMMLQYEDSCLAEKILLRLLTKGICCIPVHDSFIVQIIHAQTLRQTMFDVYFERFGRTIGLGERHLFQEDEQGRRLFEPQFIMPFKEPAHAEARYQEMDYPAFIKLMTESRYNRFLAGG